MKNLFFLIMVLACLSAGCAALSGQKALPKRGVAAAKRPSTLEGGIYSPVRAGGICQIDTTENSITSIQDGVKVTLKFLDPTEKKEMIRGSDVFSENIFEAVLATIENSSGSKIKLPLSEAVSISQGEQLEVLSYKGAVLLAISSTAEYAQRAAEPYLRAGLSPTYARQQVVDQAFQAIQSESGLPDYKWMEERPTVTVFPTVRISKVLLWDALRFREKSGRTVRIIVPDIVVEFDPAGNPSKVIDFWFDFETTDDTDEKSR